MWIGKVKNCMQSACEEGVLSRYKYGGRYTVCRMC